jgi:hypothetical protein
MVEVGKVIDWSGKRWKVLEIKDGKAKLKCQQCVNLIRHVEVSKLA